MDPKIWPWKNQHTYLEKAPKEEKTPAIAVFFLKKSPKYLILSGLVKLVEKNRPLMPVENKRLDNITKTQFLWKNIYMYIFGISEVGFSFYNIGDPWKIILFFVE